MKKTNVPGSQSFGQKLLQFIRNNTVPIMFILICAYCIPQAGFSWSYLLNEVMTRLGRNAFLILSLLIPVMAGMGMNFGMTLGAMAGEIGLIFAADWQVWGIPGMILAAIVSIPISVALGVMIGKILNRSKGREMITSYMISFTMNGVYQFVVLFMMGPIIPRYPGGVSAGDGVPAGANGGPHRIAGHGQQPAGHRRGTGADGGAVPVSAACGGHSAPSAVRGIAFAAPALSKAASPAFADADGGGGRSAGQREQRLDGDRRRSLSKFADRPDGYRVGGRIYRFMGRGREKGS